MANHRSQLCPHRPVSCSNAGCESVVRHNQILQHRSECLFEEVACPLFVTGCGRSCTGRLLRRDVETHLSDPSVFSAALIGLVSANTQLLAANSELKVLIIIFVC